MFEETDLIFAIGRQPVRFSLFLISRSVEPLFDNLKRLIKRQTQTSGYEAAKTKRLDQKRKCAGTAAMHPMIYIKKSGRALLDKSRLNEFLHITAKL